MGQGTILVIEDDLGVSRLICDSLETARFQVVSVQSGRAGLDILSKASPEPDVVILDINLPDLDGLSVCRELRRFSDAPVLMLSSLDQDLDRVIGLEVGADDYLGKPFDPRELVARIRALHRRHHGFPERGEPSVAVSRGPFNIDALAHTVHCDGVLLELTRIEFGLLNTLISDSGRVHSRQDLLDVVWGPDYVGDERLVDVHIRNLRKKIAARNSTEFIKSIRGVGYRWMISN